MPDFLTFTLAAPMASFGLLAGTERRGSVDRPGHSLFVGLLGAALGLERDDPRLLQFSDSARFAALCIDQGRPFKDYHTIQTVRSRRNIRYATRREALASDDVETSLTERGYVSDALYYVVMALDENSDMNLGTCVKALKNPHFTLYFGRKACPLALPLAPEIYVTQDALAALEAYRNQQEQKLVDLWPTGKRVQSGEITGAPSLLRGKGDVRRQNRRSQPRNRVGWQYGLLEELTLTMPPSSAVGQDDKDTTDD